MNLLDGMSTDDTLVFQGQFNRAEPISNVILVIRLPYRTVCALKVDTFGQKWPQNGIILANIADFS